MGKAISCLGGKKKKSGRGAATSSAPAPQQRPAATAAKTSAVPTPAPKATPGPAAVPVPVAAPVPTPVPVAAPAPSTSASGVAVQENPAPLSPGSAAAAGVAAAGVAVGLPVAALTAAVGSGPSTDSAISTNDAVKSATDTGAEVVEDVTGVSVPQGAKDAVVSSFTGAPAKDAAVPTSDFGGLGSAGLVGESPDGPDAQGISTLGTSVGDKAVPSLLGAEPYGSEAPSTGALATEAAVGDETVPKTSGSIEFDGKPLPPLPQVSGSAPAEGLGVGELTAPTTRVIDDSIPGVSVKGISDSDGISSSGAALPLATSVPAGLAGVNEPTATYAVGSGSAVGYEPPAAPLSPFAEPGLVGKPDGAFTPVGVASIAGATAAVGAASLGAAAGSIKHADGPGGIPEPAFPSKGISDPASPSGGFPEPVLLSEVAAGFDAPSLPISTSGGASASLHAIDGLDGKPDGVFAPSGVIVGTDTVAGAPVLGLAGASGSIPDIDEVSSAVKAALPADGSLLESGKLASPSGFPGSLVAAGAAGVAALGGATAISAARSSPTASGLERTSSVEVAAPSTMHSIPASDAGAYPTDVTTPFSPPAEFDSSTPRYAQPGSLGGSAPSIVDAGAVASAPRSNKTSVRSLFGVEKTPSVSEVSVPAVPSLGVAAGATAFPDTGSIRSAAGDVFPGTYTGTSVPSGLDVDASSSGFLGAPTRGIDGTESVPSLQGVRDGYADSALDPPASLFRAPPGAPPRVVDEVARAPSLADDWPPAIPADFEADGVPTMAPFSPQAEVSLAESTRAVPEAWAPTGESTRAVPEAWAPTGESTRPISDTPGSLAAVGAAVAVPVVAAGTAAAVAPGSVKVAIARFNSGSLSGSGPPMSPVLLSDSGKRAVDYTAEGPAGSYNESAVNGIASPGTLEGGAGSVSSRAVPSTTSAGVQVLVLLASESAHLQELAAALRQGVRDAGAQATLKTIPKAGVVDAVYDAFGGESLPAASPSELRAYNAVVFGSTTTLSPDLSNFLEDVDAELGTTLLKGKVGSVFTVAEGTPSGGPLVMSTVMNFFLRHGMLVVGQPNAKSGPSDTERAKFQGTRVVGLAPKRL